MVFQKAPTSRHLRRGSGVRSRAAAVRAMRRALVLGLLLAGSLAAQDRPLLSWRISLATLVAADTADILTSRSLQRRGIGHETNHLFTDA
jgi:hypothetical protein